MEFQHLSDFRFLEHAVYDYVLAQKHPDDMLVARMLVVNYQLGNDEIELLKTVEPDKPGDTLANWVLMLDGLNLGLHVAGLLVEDMPERQPEWSRGVRQVLARVSETASKILARQQKAKADQDPAFELFHNAWNRVRQNADTLDRRLKTLAGRELPSPLAPPSPAARPAAKPTRATENVEPFSSRQKLIIAGAGVVVLIAIVSCLYFLGVFAPKAEKVEIKLDASGLALPVLKSYTEGKAMVAEVDVNAWQALPESGQTEFLLALYDRAVKANAGQVQLRGGGKILGQAWSRNKIKIFSK